MFFGLENTQKDVASLLEELCNSGKLPSALLFSGSEFSSRMYAAMCVAKFFKSDEDSTIILSDRNYDIRIKAALNLFRKQKNKASGKFLSDILSVFLKQYHGALLDSNAPSEKKNFTSAGECSELVSQLVSSSGEDAETLCNKLEKSLSGLKLSKQISVSQIRAIRNWCSTSSTEGKKKIVVIEGLENSTPSASNALLKIVEEPPEDTFFILISDNSGRIPSTVLSRVRKFNFAPFGTEEKKYILGSLFINSGEYPDMKTFFVSSAGIDNKMLSEAAHSLIYTGRCVLPKLVGELEKTQAWNRFYELLVENVRQRVFDGEISVAKAEKLTSEIRNILSGADVFNQNKRLSFDYVIYRTGEILA